MATYGIISTNDDGYWYSTTFNRTNNYCRLGSQSASYGYTSFLRFSGVSINRGETISSAKLTVRAYSSYITSAINLKIRCVKQDSPSAPSSVPSWTYTTNGTDWDISSEWGSGTTYDSPDFSSSVQEVLAESFWDSGDALIVAIQDDGSSAGNYRSITSRDGSYQIILTIETGAPTWCQDSYVSCIQDAVGTITKELSVNKSTIQCTQDKVYYIDSGSTNTHYYRIGAGEQDVEWVEGGTADSSANYVRVGYSTNKYGGYFFFPEIGIPFGAKITSAIITFEAQQAFSGSTHNLKIHTIDQWSNTSPIPDYLGGDSFSVHTCYSSPQVNWDISSSYIANDTITSPNVSMPVQMCVSRDYDVNPGSGVSGRWCPGKSIAFLIVNDTPTSQTSPLYLKAKDLSGYSGALLTVTWSMLPTVKTYAVLDNQSDGWWTSSSFYASGADPSVISGSTQYDGMPYHYNSFLRFDGVNIPPGSIVSDAWLSIAIDKDVQTNENRILICLENSSDAATISSRTDADSRSVTTGYTWVITSSWYGYRDNLASEFYPKGFYIFQRFDLPIDSDFETIFARSGWDEGNALQLFLKGNWSLAPSGNEARQFIGFYDTPSAITKLTVEYQEQWFVHNSIISLIQDVAHVYGTIVSAYDSYVALTQDVVVWEAEGDVLEAADSFVHLIQDHIDGEFVPALGALSLSANITAPAATGIGYGDAEASFDAPLPTCYGSASLERVYSCDAVWRWAPSLIAYGDAVAEIEAPLPTLSAIALIGISGNLEARAPMPTCYAIATFGIVFSMDNVIAPMPRVSALADIPLYFSANIEVPSRITLYGICHIGSVYVADVITPIPTCLASATIGIEGTLDADAPMPTCIARATIGNRFSSYVLRHDRGRVIV